ncbi:NAD(P)-binding domain-containing protein [Comamonas sp. Y33R10-2]|nr:NAD(P)-binding domain-containing protein [Comamonas sp. Y33R10-2]
MSMRNASTTEKKPCVAIVGAGTSGVVCAKVLSQQGLDVVVFEKGSQLGGLWRFGNDNGMSSIYRSLHINTSKRMMQLSDFPMPAHIAEYPSHTEIIEYFESYAEAFNVRALIRFNTEVLHISKVSQGQWLMKICQPDGQVEVQEFEHVVIANGHHWNPRMVKFPGHFNGQQFHAHHYVDIKSPVNMAGKRVVVIGAGNSAMDIASELGQALRMDMSTPADQVTGPVKVILSQRSGVWIAPKVLGNIAQDSKVRHPMTRPGLMEKLRRRYVPRALRTKAYNLIAEHLIRSVAGDPSRVGLKQPVEPYSYRHGTISQDIHSRLIHGDIVPKGNITELRGDTVVFEDGSQERVDVLVHCSGYRITFPFFDANFISAPNNDIALWQRMVLPQHQGLYFVGLVQPKCSMMPVAELQSSFLADAILGRIALPNPETMEREMHQAYEAAKSGFTRSESHTIQIDCEEYSHDLFAQWEQCLRLQKKAA